MHACAILPRQAIPVDAVVAVRCNPNGPVLR
jgi:hypothetical protein